MSRYLCIHGHFYQPPRENPWLEAIEMQDSAAPYHDWNARIDAECYGQNAVSRILGENDRIARIVNNYARISFNFGPTVLSWLESFSPRTYEAILAADRAAQERFAGHGSALAQAYNHVIMPLANRRDKETQIRWGIRDFEHRFGRRPEGMWLPETAVDTETLDLLAEHEILFTILSPYQARRTRAIGQRKWTDATGGRVDPSRAYRANLPSGRTIALFFYDGPISQAVAFERLLANGEQFAARLRAGFSEERTWPQLVHIATDGESYGHHHRHGDMALAAALERIEEDETVRLTNYGEFLATHPPTEEAEVVESSAWSCSHGVGRWSRDCGCNTGGHPEWNQAWRQPLRDALDDLRDRVAGIYEEGCRGLLRDPWAARNEYAGVVLDRSPDNVRAFFERYAEGERSPEADVRRLKLLELQRHAILMYTSCGWFFDEISGMETIQVIEYAGRALQLASELSGQDVETPFLERLQAAKSNVPEHQDGKRVYEKWVRPAMLDLERVGAHFALSSLFEDYADQVRIYCYEAERLQEEKLSSGRMTLALGRVRIRSTITWNTGEMSYVAVHVGAHNMSGGIDARVGAEEFREQLAPLIAAFKRADIPDVVRQLDRRFGDRAFSLRSLFRDEQRKILDLVLADTVAAADAAYVRIYQDQAGLMLYLADHNVPIPAALSVAADRAVNHRLQRVFLEEGPLDRQVVVELLQEAKERRVHLDSVGLEFAFRQRIERLAESFRGDPHDLERLAALEGAADIVAMLPFRVDVWRVQNDFDVVRREHLTDYRWRHDLPGAQEWLRRFLALGEVLGVEVE
jgi:alpha-amylase/alpha-mannosidase (GH57 family)